jgi:hypothetical protein
VTTARLIPYEVVWCGARIKNDWSKTRGELLGDYSQVPASKEVREVARPFKVRVAGGWGPQVQREEES